MSSYITIKGAKTHNLKNINLVIPKNKFSVVTGVSGSGKSSLVFDTILKEAERRFFSTLSHYAKHFLNNDQRAHVDGIYGLSPAIGLSQKETLLQKKLHVAGYTELEELLAILFAKFFQRFCPTHNLPAEAKSKDDIVQDIVEKFDKRVMLLCVNISEQQKGSFEQELQSFVKKGFLKIIHNGKLLSLHPLPRLNKDMKHTLYLCIDIINIREDQKTRILRSLEQATSFKESIECFEWSPPDLVLAASRTSFCVKEGCPQCSYYWPKLTPRHFHSGSLGACDDCQGRGFLFDEKKTSKETHECHSCQGIGLKKHLLHSIRLDHLSPFIVYHTPIDELISHFKDLKAKSALLQKDLHLVLSKILEALIKIQSMRLSFLTLKQKVLDLAYGEIQRLRLSRLLHTTLRGILFILDEPSQGLSSEDTILLIKALKNLCLVGNTVIIVDHRLELIKEADLIIELGPSGGEEGGNVIATFQPKDAALYQQVSKTAYHLCQIGMPSAHKTKDPKELIEIKLGKQQLGFYFAKEAMTLVREPKVNHKSSFLKDIKLYRDERIKLDDKGPLPFILEGHFAKAHAGSMVASFLGIYPLIREIFAQTTEAQILGITPSDLSLMKKGQRCEACLGKGVTFIELKFLPRNEAPCAECQGDRYLPLALQLEYQGYRLKDILQMSIAHAFKVFNNHQNIKRVLEQTIDLGLSYLKLGQSLSELSGGEYQRLRLFEVLLKHKTMCIILHEASVGLHLEDLRRLISLLEKKTKEGHTFLIIDHHPEWEKASQFVVDRI